MDNVQLILSLRAFMMDMPMIFKVLVRIVMESKYFVNALSIKYLTHNFSMIKIKEN